MVNEKLFTLGFLFSLWTLIIVLYTLLSEKRRGTKFQVIFFVNLFYCVIYGLAPAAICFYIGSGAKIELPLTAISFEDNRINDIFLFLASSVIGFLGINFGYKAKIKYKRVEFSHSEDGRIIAMSNKKIRTASFCLMIIGLVSLMLWTHVYGGPLGILPYANALRAGRETGIYNPWSFMMKMCPFMQLAAYVFFSLYLSYKRVGDLLLFIISGSGTFLYILANSSRMHLALFFVILILLYASHRKMTARTYFIFGIVAVISLGVMNVGESIMNVFQENGQFNISDINLNVIKIVRDEFFFPMASFQTYREANSSGLVGFRLFTDIVNAFFAWLPSRFKPAGLVNLEITNTIFHSGTTIYGGLPTDLITTCFYEMNIIGIWVIPVLFGVLAKKFEKNVRPKIGIDYYKVIYILGVFYFIKAIGYADPANIMSNIFFLVWGHIFTKVVCNFSIGRHYGERL